MAKAASRVQTTMSFSDQFLDEADFDAVLRILDEGLIEDESTLAQQEINQGHAELEEELSDIANEVKM